MFFWLSWGKHLSIYKNSSILTSTLELVTSMEPKPGFHSSTILNRKKPYIARFSTKHSCPWAKRCLGWPLPPEQSCSGLCICLFHCSRQQVRPGACFSTGVKKSQMMKEGLKHLHYQSLCETSEKEYLYIRNILTTWRGLLRLFTQQYRAVNC